MSRLKAPSHPGEILREEFLSPLDMTAYALAKAINVTRPRVEELVRERRPITADMAHRLSRRFGTTPGFWMNLQTNFDLAETVRNEQAEYEAIEPLQLAG